MLSDYVIKGLSRPDMTWDAFWTVLRGNNSPVPQPDARTVYDYVTTRHTSHAFLLGMFHHESTFGKFGSAVTTHSFGNTRPPSIGPVESIGVSDRHFSIYRTWADGGVSTVARWMDYAPYLGKNSVVAVIPTWAPSSDGNNTERYIASVLSDIETWTRPQETSMSVPKPPMTSKPSPNRGGYQHAHDPRCVVWHITQGSNSLPWLTNPASGASSNYLIARNGTIYELVPPSISAWANGKVDKPDLANPVIAGAIREGRNLNTVSISIEHEGFTSQGKGGSLTTAQVDATVALSAWLCATEGIAPDRTHILGHFQVDSVDRPNCPGFSGAEWNAWIGRVAALVNATPAPGMMEPVITEPVNWQGKGRIIRQTVVVSNDDEGKYYERVKEYEATGPVMKDWREV